MKNISANAGFWSTGTLVAICGVVCARVLAPSYTGNLRVGVTLGGQLLALSGLLILCLGVRRRIKQTPTPGPSEN